MMEMGNLDSAAEMMSIGSGGAEGVWISLPRGIGENDEAENRRFRGVKGRCGRGA